MKKNAKRVFVVLSILLMTLIQSTQAAPTAISYDLVWADNSQNSIYQANLDGTSPQVLVDEGIIPLSTTGSAGNFTQRGMETDNSYVYWTDNSQDSIYRANLDGTSPQVLVDEADIPLSSTGLAGTFGLQGIAVHGSYIYWADANQDSIYRSNLDGSSPQVLVDEADIPLSSTGAAGIFNQVGITVDDSYIYWADNGQDSIYRANLDGTSPQVLVDEADIPLSSTGSAGAFTLADMTMDGSYIYWADNSQESIYRADLDGTSPMVLVDAGDIPISSTGSAGVFDPQGMEVDGSYVYWTDTSQDSIYQANLDGTSPQVLVDAGDIPESSTGSAGSFGQWGIALQSVTTCINSAQSGLWVSGTTWVGGTAPIGSDDVCINSGHTVTLSANAAANWLQVNSGGTLDLATFSFTVENGVTNNGIIQQTQNVGTSSTVNFLQIQPNGGGADQYRGVDITTDASTNLGSTTVSVKAVDMTTEYCTLNGATSPAYAGRCFTITPANNLPANVMLWALTSEAAGLTSASPYHYNGIAWQELANIATGTSGSYTWVSGDAPGFSPFLMAEAGGFANAPTAVSLQSINTTNNMAFIPILIATLMLLLVGGIALRRRA